MPAYSSHQREKGAALVISLLLLLVMTILAVSMSQNTTLQERMARNTRDAEAAFQSAEAGLRAGEDLLKGTEVVIVCNDLTSCQSTKQYYFSGTDLTTQDDSWWTNNGTEFGTAGAKDISDVVADPRYVVTKRGSAKDSLTTGKAGSSSAITFYEITSRSHGITDSSEAVTQEIYAKRTLN